MSANNQLIIKKRSKGSNKWDIYMNCCVDNDFSFEEEDKLKTETSLKKAINWCNDYMSRNLVEYSYLIYGDLK